MVSVRIPVLQQKSQPMALLDRMPWAAGISFLSFGVRIGIRSTSPELLEQALPLLPRARKVAAYPVVDRLYSIVAGAPLHSKTGEPYRLYGDTKTLIRTSHRQPLLDKLEHDLNFNIAKSSTKLLFVHSGAVGWKGRAIVFPAGSFSGKSALTKEFLLLGAEYYSDEFTVFDPQGRVHPFPRRLCLRDEVGDQTYVHFSKFGARAGTIPLPVGLFVMTRYKPGTTWHPRIGTYGESVLELLSHSVLGRTHHERALSTFQKALQHAFILDGLRGNGRDAAVSMLQLLDRLK